MPDAGGPLQTNSISSYCVTIAKGMLKLIGAAYLAAIVYLPSYYYHTGFFETLRLDPSLAPVNLADIPNESYWAVVRTVGTAISHPNWSRLRVFLFPEVFAAIVGGALACGYLYVSKREKQRISDNYLRNLQRDTRPTPPRVWLKNMLIVLAGTLGFPALYPIVMWLVAVVFISLLALPLMFADAIGNEARHDAITAFANIEKGTPVTLKKETGISTPLHLMVCVSDHCIVGDKTEVVVIARDAIETGERHVQSPE